MSRRGRNPYRWQNPNSFGRGRFDAPNKSFNRPPSFRGMPPRLSKFPGGERFPKRDFRELRKFPRDLHDDEEYYPRESMNRNHEERYHEPNFESSRYDDRNYNSFKRRNDERYSGHVDNDDGFHTRSDRSDFFGGKFPSTGRPPRDNYFENRSDFPRRDVEFNVRNKFNENQRFPEEQRFENEQRIGGRYDDRRTYHDERPPIYSENYDSNIPFDRQNDFGGFDSRNSDIPVYSREYFNTERLERYEKELQRRENENNDRMKNALLEHLQPEPTGSNPESSSLNIDEITKILNNPSLKQLLKTVGDSNQQNKQLSAIGKEQYESDSSYSRNNYRDKNFEDDEDFLYGDNRSKKSFSDELSDFSTPEKNFSPKYESHSRSKKRKRSWDFSSSSSRSRSPDRSKKHRSKKKRSRTRERSHKRSRSHYSRHSPDRRRKSSEKSKNIEKFLLNAADNALKGNFNISSRPFYFNRAQPSIVQFPPPNAKIVRLQAPVLPVARPQYVDYTLRNNISAQQISARNLPIANSNTKRDDLFKQAKSQPQSIERGISTSSRLSHHSDNKKSSEETSQPLSLNEMISTAKRESRKSTSRERPTVTSIDRGFKIVLNLPVGSEHSQTFSQEAPAKDRKRKYKPWYNDLCKRIERRRKSKQKMLSKAKSYPNNTRQIDLCRESLRQVTRLYTHTLRQAKAKYFKDLEGDTEEFCELMLRDMIDKVCTHERKGTSDEVRIKSLNKKFNLSIPLPNSVNVVGNMDESGHENEKCGHKEDKNIENEKSEHENEAGNDDKSDSESEKSENDDVDEKDSEKGDNSEKENSDNEEAITPENENESEGENESESEEGKEESEDSTSNANNSTEEVTVKNTDVVEIDSDDDKNVEISDNSETDNIKSETETEKSESETNNEQEIITVSEEHVSSDEKDENIENSSATSIREVVSVDGNDEKNDDQAQVVIEIID